MTVFEGKPGVDIRQWFVSKQDGNKYPGKKGIRLNPAEWGALSTFAGSETERAAVAKALGASGDEADLKALDEAEAEYEAAKKHKKEEKEEKEEGEISDDEFVPATPEPKPEPEKPKGKPKDKVKKGKGAKDKSKGKAKKGKAAAGDE